MSADVYFKKDIANALLATYQSARETTCAIGSDDTAQIAMFHAGYRAAISTLALFFGISPAAVLPDEPPSYRTASERLMLGDG